jgi:hypothetical protein
LLALTFLLLPSFANSQTKTLSKTKDTLNIGFVLYTKGSTPGTFYARWNYHGLQMAKSAQKVVEWKLKMV